MNSDINTNNNISFDDNLKFKSRTIFGQSQTPGMTRFLMKKGIVKNEKQATIFMFTTSIIFFLLSIYVFIVYVFDIQLFNKTTVTPEQIQANRERMEQIRNRAQNNTNTENVEQTQ